MKTILTSVCSVALLCSVPMIAQDKGAAGKQSQETQQDTKTTTANGTSKTSTDTVYGKVETYEPGKSIKVTIPGKIASTKSFDLDAKDTTFNVASSVKQGDWVSVMEKTDNNGHKTVTVEPSARHSAARAKKPGQ